MEIPLNLQKIQAINKAKQQQLLDNFFLYSITVLSCLFCSSIFCFPYAFSSFKSLLFVSLPKIISLFLSYKSIFILGNLIVFLLIGESKFFAPNHSAGADVYYKEYLTQKRTLQSSPNLQGKKEIKVEHCPNKATILIKDHEDRGNKEGKRRGMEVKKEKQGFDKKQEVSLSTDDLNKRADDFIARVNRQRRLEARLLL